MARRQLLTEEQWARLLAPPSDEREIIRYWTLSREDFDIIFRKRSDHSRLGFALLLCYLRYPGRVLSADEVPPVALVSFIARQLAVSPAAFTRYSQRDQIVGMLRRLLFKCVAAGSRIVVIVLPRKEDLPGLHRWGLCITARRLWWA
jgi:uncharacterized protein DUF4158